MNAICSSTGHHVRWSAGRGAKLSALVCSEHGTKLVNVFDHRLLMLDDAQRLQVLDALQTMPARRKRTRDRLASFRAEAEQYTENFFTCSYPEKVGAFLCIVDALAHLPNDSKVWRRNAARARAILKEEMRRNPEGALARYGFCASAAEDEAWEARHA